jgi:two-component system, OmpR family, response regulator
MRLLVVEDDPSMVDLLRRALEREAYAVDVVGTGDEALWAVAEHPYDAVVLDVMIPAPDGFTVVRRLRASGQQVPVLMLTARDAVGDRVTGLDAGADDYLTKPFAITELFARVRALVRRGPAARPPHLVVGDLALDPSTHRATRSGRKLELTPKAFALLEYFMHRPGQVVSRAELLEHVWDFAFDGSSNVVDAYVSRVRDAVDKPFDDPLIETVRGVGYRLRA